jgi:hypothetical protein
LDLTLSLNMPGMTTERLIRPEPHFSSLRPSRLCTILSTQNVLLVGAINCIVWLGGDTVGRRGESSADQRSTGQHRLQIWLSSRRQILKLTSCLVPWNGCPGCTLWVHFRPPRHSCLRAYVRLRSESGRIASHQRNDAMGLTGHCRVYSITSSAIESRPGGMATPRALAVVRLMTNSNLVGWSTGRLAGFSPLRMRPT